MPDDLPPSLFQILREDIASINSRLDRLVTHDAFTGEQRRVDELLARLGNDLVKEREERIAGDAANETDIQKVADDAKQAKDSLDGRKVTFRQGMTIALVAALAGGVIGLLVLVVQNITHLG